MISLQINDTKQFMNKLFLSDYFDAFFFSEATFVTFNTFHIDGSLKKDYYSSEELDELQINDHDTSTWRQVRPFCLELVKGKHTPLEFKIVFRLSPSNTQKVISRSGSSLTANDVNGLFLNLHFHSGSMVCTTGTSLCLFTLDKSLEHTWDDMVKKFLFSFC